MNAKIQPETIAEETPGPEFLKVRDDDAWREITVGPQGQSLAELRKEIEPWLTALFQSENLSLLVGSGLTSAISYFAANEQATSMAPVEFKIRGEQINLAAAASSVTTDRKAPNIEDQFRVANELLRGLEILGCKDADDLRDEISRNLNLFANSILVSENQIATAPSESRNKALNHLVSFFNEFREPKWFT